MLIKPFFVAIGRSYLHDLSTTLLKRLNYYEVKLHVKSASFPTDNIFLFFTIFPTIKTLSQNISITLLQFLLTSRTSRRLLEEKAPVIDFGRTVPT